MPVNRIVREIEVDGEPVQYAINTRGADRPWSAADDEAMQAIVRAAVRLHRDRTSGAREL